MIDRAVKAFTDKDGGLINEFIPCPQELEDTDAVHYPAGMPEAVVQQRLEQANIAKYGYANWYNFRNARWGTKWDVSADSEDSVKRIDANTVTLTFDSAWSPPIEAYQAFEAEHNFVVEAYYYEPGMAFAGMFEGGCEHTINDISSAAVARDLLPPELDEMFAISENMEMWEEDEE